MATKIPKETPKEIEREALTFRDNYSEIMKHEGKFVLIQGQSVVSFFPSYGEAIADGYKRFGLENFLVQQVRSNPVPIRAMRCGAVRHDGKLRLARASKR